MEKKRLTEALLSRFLCYARIDSMSDEKIADKGTKPSTACQLDMFKQLRRDLISLGIEDIEDGGYYLLARIKANVKGVPCIGLMAHVDTAHDVEGNGVKPIVHENYDGNDIILDGVTITRADNPELGDYVGSTVVTSDGTTLLGADDKAGVAEIMVVAQQLMEDTSLHHGEVEFIFTSDEETGHGMDRFPYEHLHCSTCYTLDGGARYIIETECFNASHAKVLFEGKSYHFGAARNRMINALNLASKFLQALPAGEQPDTTEGREGYFGPEQLQGTVAHAQLDLLVRDFDLDQLERRENLLRQIAASLQQTYPGSKVSVVISRQYYNMLEIAKQHPSAVQNVLEAGRRLSQPLSFAVIRGGTDGARMANEADIPCPNLYTGGYNYHSLYEWCALDAMADATALVLGILAVAAVTQA